MIDATKTLLAVHLTSSDGGHAGFNNLDGYYNIELIGEKYEYHLGGTTNAQYLTKLGKNGEIVVAKDNKTVETIKNIGSRSFQKFIEKYKQFIKQRYTS